MMVYLGARTLSSASSSWFSSSAARSLTAASLAVASSQLSCTRSNVTSSSALGNVCMESWISDNVCWPSAAADTTLETTSGNKNRDSQRDPIKAGTFNVIHHAMLTASAFGRHTNRLHDKCKTHSTYTIRRNRLLANTWLLRFSFSFIHYYYSIYSKLAYINLYVARWTNF